MTLTTWSGSLHQTFRLIGARSRSLVPFLSSDGKTPSEVLALLPYDSARAAASGGGTGSPDAKRYRDARQVYQTAGLAYEGLDTRLHVTQLGQATLRWVDLITPRNSVILGRHAAYALSACQLRTPTGSGSRYDESMIVFPFQFIWKAMLGLDGRITSDELNREIFRTRNESDLETSIQKIAFARASGNPSGLRDEVITGDRKNDRIIPWLSLASFGWTLFPDKGGDDFYSIPESTLSIVREASRIRHKHRGFESVPEYVEYLSSCACLPKDLR